MKRIVIILLLLVTMYNTSACTGSRGDKSSSLGNEIEVLSPMTLSNNYLQNKTVRLKLVKGRYYEDWNPGAIMGTIWEGDFIIEVADESGKILAESELSKFHSDEPLMFTSSFDIQFDDYNNDGDIDFTIGQYASSNGRYYKIFTIRRDGKVDELKLKGYPYLFISDSTDYYSTKLKKVDEITFKKEHYDNSKGKTIEDYFKWNGSEFIHIDS
ncbi:MAG: hypothetical protein ACOYWZ_02930 [Bacillota bacterium]